MQLYKELWNAFNDIHFEEVGHKYTDSVGTKYTSVTTFIGQLEPDKDWDMMMEVAVNSHYIMCREFFPIIPAGSRILFTGSQMGINPHAMVLA